MCVTLCVLTTPKALMAALDHFAFGADPGVVRDKRAVSDNMQV